MTKPSEKDRSFPEGRFMPAKAGLGVTRKGGTRFSEEKLRKRLQKIANYP